MTWATDRRLDTIDLLLLTQGRVSCLDYRAALKRLGLTPASKRTAELLGISVRQAQRLANGSSPVTPTVEQLLRAYLAHGLPED